MADSDQSLAVKTVTKLLLSAEHYATVSPALARFYMLEAEHLKKKLHLPSSSATQICPYCYMIRRPDNCTRRLRSKMNTSRRIRRLKRKLSNGRTVCKFVKRVLDVDSDGANRLQIQCHCCRRQTSVRAACRPAKASKASDITTRKEDEMQVVKKKNRKRKRNQTMDSDTKASKVSVGRDVAQKSLEKCAHQTPLHAQSQEKHKVTNKKETLKRKHNMLQNILKQKSNAASPDTSAALKRFLTSL